jgi:uracil-DNA glycosylase
VDAREQLRRYLEQRREAGETELVLDRLSVTDALRLLGASRTTDSALPPAESRTDWRATLRAVDAKDSDAQPVDERLAPPPRDSAARPTFSNKRDQFVGDAAPTSERSPDDASSASHATMSLKQVPSGLVVGVSSKELFGGPASQFATLNDIVTAVASCTSCPLHRSAKNPVPGEGNARAGLVCVGEAPGAVEDQTGRPFVGPAGQLLDKILGAIKLSRSDVYICNVLKHRPPANRNPMPDEVQACSPYLVRQIELIEPKVIVAFGTFAAQTLLNTKDAIGRLRGKIHRYYGVPLVVTYHPAALLRNPGWKRPTWEDVQLARRLLDRADDT